MNKCLYCYKPLADGEVDYHKTCARKIFESTTVPVLPYTRDNIKELAREIVTASTTVTGVQAKLSLDISRGRAGEPILQRRRNRAAFRSPPCLLSFKNLRRNLM